MNDVAGGPPGPGAVQRVHVAECGPWSLLPESHVVLFELASPAGLSAPAEISVAAAVSANEGGCGGVPLLHLARADRDGVHVWRRLPCTFIALLGHPQRVIAAYWRDSLAAGAGCDYRLSAELVGAFDAVILSQASAELEIRARRAAVAGDVVPAAAAAGEPGTPERG